MTTSSLYHGFGLKYQKLITTLFKNGSIIAKVKTKSDKLQCSSCKSRRTIKAGTVLREFKTVPIGFKPVKIQIELHQIKLL